MKRTNRIYRYLFSYLLIGSLLAVPVVTVSQSGIQKPYRNNGKAILPASPAAPGDLDPTFSGDGKLLDGILSNGDDQADGVAVQPDGKIVVAGTKYNGSNYDFALVRYNPDGLLDTTFDSDGKVTTPIGTSDEGAHDVAIQPDGKIVAAGYSHNGSNDDFALVRYNSNGSLDTTFDGDGKVTTPIGTLDDIAHAVAIQPDGKIVAAGYGALVRYNTDGSLDTTFDSDGKVTTPIGTSYVAIQQDGKIVAAGSSYNGSNNDFALLRYNPDGSLDTTFDGDGKVTTTIGENGSDAYAVAIGPDGKIVAAGRSISPQTGYDFALARYNSDGSLDATFDGDGKVTTADGSCCDFANDVAIQPDGKIIAAGHRFQTLTGYDFKLVRFNTNGSLDTTFDSDGTVVTDFGQSYDVANAIAIQPDGKIIAAGSSGNWNRDFALIRYNQNGSLDTTFDSDGKVTTWFGVIVGNALFDVTIQPDGKIVAVGVTDGEVVARYNSDGTRDTTFGTTGIVPGAASSVAIQQDGKIVAAGGSFLLTRLNQDGSLDATFDGDGIVTNSYFFGVAQVLIQQDGKVLVAGSYCTGYDDNGACESTGFALARVNTDGTIDTTFDGDGIVTFYIACDSLNAVAIQPDGKIVAAGNSYDGSIGTFALVRYNPDGSLDTTFDGDGIVTTPIGTFASANSVAIQSNGKIVAAGYGSANGFGFALARYNPDGSLDTSFDNDGIVTTAIGTSSIANSVAMQSDGKIVAAGASSFGPNADFALVRYNPNGSLDTTFGGGDGITTVDFNNSVDFAHGMALDGQGRAVVVGSSDGAFALARFLLGSPTANVATPFDFDGDGRSDVSVFRPSDGVWYLNRSTQGFSVTPFGISTDAIVPADYDGDGKTDIAVFRPSTGTWYILNSQSQSFQTYTWGVVGDLPVPSDRDGDGKADLVIFRPSTGTWYTRFSNNSFSTVSFGVAGDKPVVGDFDGDGKSDVAVWRPSDGNWYILKTGLGFFVQTWGVAGDIPVPADYDGDGKTDVAIWRPSTGQWYRVQSSAGFDTTAPRGVIGDVPVPADYDGDGKADIAVFRPSNGTWHIVRSTAGQIIQRYGQTGDLPTEGAFIY